MSADLLERARAAVTVEEECDVIRDHICATIPGPVNAHKLGLLDTVRHVRVGRLPRPVLLGAVAALVPEGGSFEAAHIRSSTERADADAKAYRLIGVDHPQSPDKAEIEGSRYGTGHAPTPALALLIAMLEAGNG